jgi:hypothetical protein
MKNSELFSIFREITIGTASFGFANVNVFPKPEHCFRIVWNLKDGEFRHVKT